jgi:nucleotidyltransferase/DNA polymerase involved in DNA repair
MTLETPTDATEVIGEAALECLERFDISKRVRLIGVRVEKLGGKG